MIETQITRSEVADLYPVLADRLRRLVRRQVNAPEALIEDACQVAWSRLLRDHARVPRGSALGWLTTTAGREALRSLNRQAREVPLDDPAESEQLATLAARAAGPEQIAEWRDKLAEVRCLPDRQQKLVWLHATGQTYAEIGVGTGDTTRTVERQLLRARQRLRAAAADGVAA
jgi:RNA polymerase sigma factor (sigma-70 family)